jgi:hypothetical protein
VAYCSKKVTGPTPEGYRNKHNKQIIPVRLVPHHIANFRQEFYFRLNMMSQVNSFVIPGSLIILRIGEYSFFSEISVDQV